MPLPKKLIKELEEIYEDCLDLKKRGKLLERGKGHLDTIKIVKKYY